MNKKLAIILTLMITSTTSLFGCSSTAKADSSSAQDTAFQVSSVENEPEDNSDVNSSDNKNTESTNETQNNKPTTNNNTSSSANKIDVSNKSNTNTTTNKSNTTTNKTTTNNNSSSTTKNENKTTTTTSTTNNNKKPTTFTAQAGYTITFPASWEDKYIIVEKPDVLIVNYKSSKDTSYPNPYLFSIDMTTPGEEYLEFDTVGDIRFFNVGDTQYCVGGPTGLTLDPSSPDFDDFMALNNQRAEVVNSIKVIR